MRGTAPAATPLPADAGQSSVNRLVFSLEMMEVTRLSTGATGGAPPRSTVDGEDFLKRNGDGVVTDIRYTQCAEHLMRCHNACRIDGRFAMLRNHAGDPECDGLYESDDEDIVGIVMQHAEDLRVEKYREVVEHAKSLTTRRARRGLWFGQDDHSFATADGKVLRYVRGADGVYELGVVPQEEVADLHLLASRTIDARYDPDARSPELERFIDRCADHNEARRKRIEECYGVWLLGSVGAKRCVVHYGETGCGKSTLAEAFVGCVGEHVVHNESLDTCGDRFGASELGDSRVFLDDELTEGVISKNSLAVFKKLTAGARHDAERKHENKRTAVSGVAFTVLTNHSLNLPQEISAKDREAIRSRIRLVHYRNPIPESEQDLGFARRFDSDHERSAALNVMIEGARRFLNQGDYTEVPEDDNLADAWLSVTTPADSFLREVGAVGAGCGQAPFVAPVDTDGTSTPLLLFPLAAFEEAAETHEQSGGARDGLAFVDERGMATSDVPGFDPTRPQFADEFAVVFGRYRAWERSRGSTPATSKTFSKQLRRLGYGTCTVRTSLGAGDGSRTAKFVVPKGVTCKAEFDAYVRSLRPDAAAHVGPVLMG